MVPPPKGDDPVFGSVAEEQGDRDDLESSRWEAEVFRRRQRCAEDCCTRTDHPELAPTDRPDLATEVRPELDRISRSTASTQLAVSETVRRPAIRCVRSLARAKLTVDASHDLDRLHERALRVATSTACR